MTSQQVELLCQLNDARPSFGELARALGYDKSNVTGVVDGLARRGLVRRETDPHDRRVIRLTHTEQGMALGEWIRAAIAELLAQCFVDLSADDRRQLIMLSQRALAALATVR